MGFALALLYYISQALLQYSKHQLLFSPNNFLQSLRLLSHSWKPYWLCIKCKPPKWQNISSSISLLCITAQHPSFPRTACNYPPVPKIVSSFWSKVRERHIPVTTTYDITILGLSKRLFSWCLCLPPLPAVRLMQPVANRLKQRENKALAG